MKPGGTLYVARDYPHAQALSHQLALKSEGFLPHAGRPRENVMVSYPGSALLGHRFALIICANDTRRAICSTPRGRAYWNEVVLTRRMVDGVILDL